MKWSSTILVPACLGLFLLGTGVARGNSLPTIVAWGDNEDGQCDVPAPNAAFIRIAVGESHGLVLKCQGPRYSRA